MSKRYKVKHDENNDIIEDNDNGLSKKELYDLKKKEKLKEKEKSIKKNSKKKNSNKKKTYKTNLAGRIFAIVMLLLMLGSVIATISYSFR